MASQKWLIKEKTIKKIVVGASRTIGKAVADALDQNHDVIRVGFNKESVNPEPGRVYRDHGVRC